MARPARNPGRVASRLQALPQERLEVVIYVNGIPAPGCNGMCYARVQCTKCKRIKAPRGRSVPLPMAGGVCDLECGGYYDEPLPPHLWPSEVSLFPPPPVQE